MKRKQKTLINIFTGVISQLLLATLGLFTTRIIKLNLGFEYMGINGVFTNIISFLNLSELGLGATILFALYKSLAEDNKQEIISILQFLKKTYYIIAAVILGIGLCIIPFLKFIVDTTLPTYYVISVFLIFLLSTVSSYFLTYKFVIITADQKYYIYTIYGLITGYIIKITQLIVFILTKNYILFLLIQIFFEIIKNILLNLKVNKLYPYLKTKNKYPLAPETKKTLVSKIKAMVFHNFGGYVVNGTDNILISTIISIITAGKYAGYWSVNNLVMTLTSQIFDSVTPSIGNFINTESIESQYNLFKKFNSITRVFYMFIPVCLTILIEPFITWWLGADTLLPQAVAVCIGVQAFFIISRKPIHAFKYAAGLFEPDKYAPIVEATINLISSVILGKILGLPGIFLGTIISFICVPIWLQPKIVFKHFFNKSCVPYLLALAKDFLITCIIYIFIFNVQNLVNIDKTFLNLIVKTGITVSLNLLIIYLLNFKTINSLIKKILFPSEKTLHN